MGYIHTRYPAIKAHTGKVTETTLLSECWQLALRSWFSPGPIHTAHRHVDGGRHSVLQQQHEHEELRRRPEDAQHERDQHQQQTCQRRDPSFRC